MNNFFQGQVAVVTGASDGIGLACSRQLAAQGAKVVLAARRAELLKKESEKLPGSLALVCDVKDAAQVDALARKTLEAFGRIDLLVNNAGILVHKPMERCTESELRDMMETNFFGAVRCAEAFLPAMRKQGSGVIVNVGSIAGRVALTNMGYYCASKFALTGWSETLRQEEARNGIRVCLVQPGTVRTAMTAEVMARSQAAGRPMPALSPEAVAAAVLRAARGGPTEIFLPWQIRLYRALHKLFPGTLERLASWYRASQAPAA